MLIIYFGNIAINFSTTFYRATEAHVDRGLIVVKNPKADDSEPPKTFSFDAVFDENVEQKYVYDVCASSVVESVLNGYNGTIFACK
jgi:kinesin family protein 3/17